MAFIVSREETIVDLRVPGEIDACERDENAQP